MAWALFILTALFGVVLFTLLKQLNDLKGRISGAEDAREQKRLEAETARTEAREQKQELERLKNEVQELRAKARKKDKESLPPGEPTEKPARAMKSGSIPPAASVNSGSAAVSAVVRISNQELEAEHRAKTDAMESELVALRAKIAELEARDQERTAALERAKKKLEGAIAAQSTAAAVPVEGKRPEEKVSSLETQLEATERAATERERQLRRELEKMTTEVRSAEKRANANHQLYQVAKGQMVVIEERLASLRKKYEGAVAPESLRKSLPPAPMAPTTESVHHAETVKPGEAAAVLAETPAPAPASTSESAGADAGPTPIGTGESRSA